MRFQDKVVIVTGAAGGIGTAIAQRFSSEGAQVVVTDVNAAGRVSGVGAQEFLTDTVATPEPETWILLGTGVLVILGVAMTKGAIRF